MQNVSTKNLNRKACVFVVLYDGHLSINLMSAKSTEKGRKRTSICAQTRAKRKRLKSKLRNRLLEGICGRT